MDVSSSSSAPVSRPVTFMILALTDAQIALRQRELDLQTAQLTQREQELCQREYQLLAERQVG